MARNLYGLTLSLVLVAPEVPTKCRRINRGHHTSECMILRKLGDFGPRWKGGRETGRRSAWGQNRWDPLTELLAAIRQPDGARCSLRTARDAV